MQAIPDALYLLRWAFIGGDEPLCWDAADVDDSGLVHGMADPTYLFRWQFAGDSAPPDPGPDTCGEDPTDDALDCEEPLTCQ